MIVRGSDLRARALVIALIAVALPGAAALHAFGTAVSACNSEAALARVYAILHDESHLDSVLLNDIHTVSGGFFSDRYECSAQVVEIRGNVNASDMPWRALRYRIERGARSEHPKVTATLGGGIPLAVPSPSLWQRLLSIF
jgi:hypothetical protein